MKVCLIRQPAGLGDILYTQKIAAHYRDMGYRILWPVIPEYAWLNDYIRDIRFISEKESFPYKEIYKSGIINVIENPDFSYVPLQYADLTFPKMRIMDAKYELSGVSRENWQNHLNFMRNKKKEDELFYDILELKDNTKYIFSNRMWGPPYDVKKNTSLVIDKDLLNIELKFIDGFTLFDWCKVVEHASEIRITHTSIVYIIEKLNLLATTLNQHLPGKQKQFDQVGALFNNVEWNYIYD